MIGVVPGSATAAAAGPLGQSSAMTARAPSVGALFVGAGLAVTVSGTGKAGSGVTVRPANGRRTQNWIVIRTKAGRGQKITLRPAYNHRLCLTRSGTETAGARLRVARCRNHASQHFIGLTRMVDTSLPILITSWDARYCLTVAHGAVAGHHVIIGRCRSALTWSTVLNLTSAMSSHFRQIEPLDPRVPAGKELAMGVAGRDRSGSKLTLQAVTRVSARQIWTDLPPGSSKPAVPFPGRSDLRPLSRPGLCITAGSYRAGVKPRLHACSKSGSGQIFETDGTGSSVTFTLIGGANLLLISVAGVPVINGVVTAGLPITLQRANDPAGTISTWHG